MGDHDVRIRRAEARDAFAVGALTLQDDREQGATPRPGFLEEFADAWLADRRRVTWIAEGDSGRPLGVIHASVVPKLPSNRRPSMSWVHVSLVYVTADHRGRGIGHALLDALLDWARGEGVDWVQLNAAEDVRDFYASAGFAPARDSLLQVHLLERTRA